MMTVRRRAEPTFGLVTPEEGRRWMLERMEQRKLLAQTAPWSVLRDEPDASLSY